MPYKIYPGAQQQLIDIWRYTDEEWGEAQANAYIDGLAKVLKEVAHSPHLWRKVNYKKMSDVFYVQYKKHVIFFRRLSGDTLGIISVLHERMNLPYRLLSDLQQAFESE